MAKKPLEIQAQEALQSHTEVTYPLARFFENLQEGYHLCTLPCTSLGELSRVNEIVERATEALVDHVGQVIPVENIIVVDSEMEDKKTGELLPCKRLILITPTGATLQTPSEHARHSLARQIRKLALAPFHRIPPYDPPLQVEAKLTPGRDRSKAPWLQLIILGDNGNAST